MEVEGGCSRGLRSKERAEREAHPCSDRSKQEVAQSAAGARAKPWCGWVGYVSGRVSVKCPCWSLLHFDDRNHCRHRMLAVRMPGNGQSMLETITSSPRTRASHG